MALDSYLTLGRSGLRVSPLALGTMTFGTDHGWGMPPAEAHTILAEYLDRGGNLIDTANVYTNGHSEEIIGDFFAGRADRDRAVISTKFFSNLHPGDPNGGGTGRKAILAQLEASLRRLRMDYVDLYWVHNWDPRTPVEETLRTLDDLVRDGRIRYVGFSDLPAWVASEAQTIARLRGWTPAIAMQLEYSLLERTSEGELIPLAQAAGMGVMPWSPLKNGLLSGKWTRSSRGDSARGHFVAEPSERDWAVIDELNAVAGEFGASAASVGLAWVMGRPGVASTLLGARRIEQFRDNLTAFDVSLTAEQRARLDDVSAPALNFPAHYHQWLSPVLQFGGMTVDGETYPPLELAA